MDSEVADILLQNPFHDDLLTFLKAFHLLVTLALLNNLLTFHLALSDACSTIPLNSSSYLAVFMEGYRTSFVHAMSLM